MRRAVPVTMAVALFGAACTAAVGPQTSAPTTAARPSVSSTGAPSPDPRIGLRAGLMDAGEAIWNLRKVSTTPPSRDFIGKTNSDLAFLGNYVIQGNYHGFQVWDITNPAQPSLVRGFVCPASQSDVSVYRNLLFVSGEGFEGRLDCGTQGAEERVSRERLRGIRIFDISDIRNPRYVGNVQTCRGSHTHSVLEHPGDTENVYVYVSGSAPVRPADELPDCVAAPPSQNPNSALFRIEIIRVPLANPAQAHIVSSPRIFEGMTGEPRRATQSPADVAEIEAARARGAFIVDIMGQQQILPPQFTQPLLDSIVRARGATGAASAADSAALRAALPAIIAARFNIPQPVPASARPGPNQCHDITLYPAIGLAGGACEGYGILLDIRNPVDPRRISAVADSNFSYWHSATFNNDGTKILFSDEWGGGGQAKCRALDPKEWGANAIFSIENGQMRFRSYYKLPAPQTNTENCVAHNGSMIPIPGRDVMVQSWYQGGISVFDWTDPDNPYEIAFHDRGPADANRMASAGTWSVYWYNGLLISSEMARGLDIFELVPSAHLTQNEIDAANTVRLTHKNAQGQPRYVWPASFVLARAYTDQLERSGGLPATRISAVRNELSGAERASGSARATSLNRLASQLDGDIAGSRDAAKLRLLIQSVRDLAR